MEPSTPIAPTVKVRDAVMKAWVNFGSPALPVRAFTQSPNTVIQRLRSMTSPIMAPTTMLIIISIGPVVCSVPFTITSIYCMAPLIPRSSTMMPLTTMSVCFKFSFINRPNARPQRLPAIIRPMLMAVPKPIIYFPSLIVKVTVLNHV